MSVPSRSAMITGAASGIGRAIAVRLATDGCAVSAADLPSARDGLDGLAGEAASGSARKARHGVDCFTMAPAIVEDFFSDELTAEADRTFENAVAATDARLSR